MAASYLEEANQEAERVSHLHTGIIDCGVQALHEGLICCQRFCHTAHHHRHDSKGPFRGRTGKVRIMGRLDRPLRTFKPHIIHLEASALRYVGPKSPYHFLVLVGVIHSMITYTPVLLSSLSCPVLPSLPLPL